MKEAAKILDVRYPARGPYRKTDVNEEIKRFADGLTNTEYLQNFRLNRSPVEILHTNIREH